MDLCDNLAKAPPTDSAAPSSVGAGRLNMAQHTAAGQHIASSFQLEVHRIQEEQWQQFKRYCHVYVPQAPKNLFHICASHIVIYVRFME
jgi:hypothetical protein